MTAAVFYATAEPGEYFSPEFGEPSGVIRAVVYHDTNGTGAVVESAAYLYPQQRMTRKDRRFWVQGVISHAQRLRQGWTGDGFELWFDPAAPSYHILLTLDP